MHFLRSILSKSSRPSRLPIKYGEADQVVQGCLSLESPNCGATNDDSGEQADARVDRAAAEIGPARIALLRARCA